MCDSIDNCGDRTDELLPCSKSCWYSDSNVSTTMTVLSLFGRCKMLEVLKFAFCGFGVVVLGVLKLSLVD